MTTESPDPYRTPAEVGTETKPASRSMMPILLVVAIAGSLVVALVFGVSSTKQVENFGDGRREIGPWEEEYILETDGEALTTTGPSAPQAAP